jgi:hypothetical protein
MIIPALEYPTHPSNPQPIYPHTSCIPKIIDIRSKPSPIIQFPHIITSLMVPPNDNSQARSNLFSRVVFMKGTQLEEFGRDS